ncbi:MAG: HAMP domain-containing sensor histidine kinase [Myxococcota bacterium]
MESNTAENSQDVQSFFLCPFLDMAEDARGADAVREALRTIPIEPSLIRDRSGWLSLERTEKGLRLLAELTGDPTVVARAGRAAFTKRYLGILRMIIRAVGSPKTGYDQMVSGAARYNKVGKFSIEHGQPGELTLVYETVGKDEQDPITCETRVANIEAFPTVFDLPEARVEHTECIHKGGARCVYHVSYPERARKPWRLLAALGGAAAGTLIGLPSFSFAAILAASFATLLYLIAANREAQGQLSTTLETVYEQQDAVELAAIDQEHRFAELLEAKAGVERQVEARTAELRATSDQLAETLDEVRELSQARTDFFSNMSHELRTPLTLMLSPLSQLTKGEEPPGGRNAALASMQRNADRLLRTINQLLDLARVESGNATAERAPVAPIDLLYAIEASFVAAVQAKGVTLNVEAEHGSNLMLDGGWMETALTNLTANALKFSRAGDVITLAVRDQGDEVIFEVRDTGRGIPANKLESLFERFARGAGPGAGTGIGLSLVHEAARLHGGRADVRSRLGEGSTFSLHIPRVVADGDAVSHTLSAQEAVADVCIERDGPDRYAPLAFVAEDNPDVRTFVADILSAHYRVRTYRNGLEVLEAVDEEIPDVFVTDVNMPEMDGLELTAALRKKRGLEDTPIVLVTARGEADQVIEGFEAGADDYVIKPFHGRELLARTDALVRAKRMAGRLVHQERLATVGVVAASVAHHIRNPLNALIGGLPAVRGRLEASNGPGLDGPTSRMFDVFMDAAERIEEVSTDLLDLSRTDREALQRFPPGRGLAASVRLMETRFGDAIQIDRAIDEDAQVEGRPGELHHVFLNLLDNAARAMSKGGKVEVVGRVNDAHYDVVVRDDGPGIPDAILDRVFEPFVTTRAAGEGTGLGLAIAADVAKRHGGSISAGRSPSGGAELHLRIPLA